MRRIFLALAVLGLSCSPTVDHEGMVLLEGGEFLMGTDNAFPFEGPIHRVTLDPFWLDETEVTNGRFAAFVEATGHVTTAETLGNSGVFKPEMHGWDLVDGADWRHPEGPASSIEGRENHPVVHMAWEDAAAYCEWAGKRLPTEAEFEFAARGGREGAEYAWGDELNPEGEFRANTWQGVFPEQDRKQDGFGGVAAVKSFPPNNEYGIYDITGNVWEWVHDWFSPNYYASSPTHDPQGPPEGQEKVQRGGSWLCSSNYCQGYRVASRMKTDPTSGLNNLGFRCAADQ